MLKRLLQFFQHQHEEEEKYNHLESLGQEKITAFTPQKKIFTANKAFKVGEWVRVIGTDQIGEVLALFGPNGSTPYNGTKFVLVRFGYSAWETKSFHNSKLEKLG